MSTETKLPIDVAQPDAPITELPPATRAVIALKSSQTEYDLRTIVSKHTGLVEIKDKAGREQVHGAAMELMRARTSIKKVADEVRDDAKKFNAAVIAEEKRLTAIVEAEETRLKALRDAWDNEQARIKKEAEERERARLLALGARIQEIRGFARLAQDCRSSDAVRRLVERMAGLDMTGFEEFEAEAAAVFAETRQQVENTLNARLATEAEAARLKAEREELSRQQAEAKQKADELAAQQKADAEKLAAERAEFARQQQEAEAKVRAAAEEMALQRAELDRQRAEIEAEKVATALMDAGVVVVEDVHQPGNTLVQKVFVAEQPTVIGVDLASKPDVHVEMKFTPGEPSQHAAQIAGYEFVTGVSVRAIQDADLVDTAPPTRAGIDSSTDAPPAASLINCIAEAYGVDAETACQWLCARADEFEAWMPAVADIA